MARPFKLDVHTARRSEILDAALGLVLSKGYERMTVNDIIGALGISSGAFYHYFGSKPGVLDAIVERIREDSEPLLRRVVDNRDLTAVEKLQDFFDVLDAIRLERRALVIEVLKVWYSDDNAIVRARVEADTYAWRAQLIGQIVRQGATEGAFAVAHPEMAGQIVMALVQAMGTAHASVMLAFAEGTLAEARLAAAVVSIFDAHMDAVERVLGARLDSLRRIDAEAVRDWSTAIIKARN